MEEKAHRAGFVNILGKPNVGKSTLMNQLVGEKLSIITSKAQTTRHRIMGIINGDDFQIIYSDTPGVLVPAYELHRAMMGEVSATLEDADVIVLMTDVYEKDMGELTERLKHAEAPIILCLNKVDQVEQERVNELLAFWKEQLPAAEVLPLSALLGFNLEKLFNRILELLPEHPAYFPKDQLTDRSERFFAAEIVREKIFLQYKKEVPYSCDVRVDEFKEEDKIIRMRAEIIVERDTQKAIIIGHKGEAIKKVGIAAREDLEKFFGKQVYLETHVKVVKDWRKGMQHLSRPGY